MNKKISQWIIDYRLPAFIITIVATALAIAGLGQLTFTSDYRIFFNDDNPQLVAYQTIQDTYGQSDNVMFLLAPRNGDIFTSENIAATEWLTKKCWELPYSQRVDSITNFQHTAVSEDDLIVSFLSEVAAEQGAGAMKEIAIQEPMLVNRLISPSAHVTAINVYLELPADQTGPLKILMNHARELKSNFIARYPQFEVYILGIAPVNHGFNEVAQSDNKTIFPAMMLVILVLVGLLLRSISSTLITMAIILMSILATFGLTGLLGVPLNTVNMITPLLLITLAVADCVHILSHYLACLRKGLDNVSAMRTSLEINLFPVFLTSFTTAIGFLSMNFSDSPPFRELGNLSGMGVAITFLFSIALLPQLGIWFTRNKRAFDSTWTEAFDKLAAFVIRNHILLFWACLLTAISVIAFIPKNELNDDNVGYFSTDLPIRQAADFAQSNLSGMHVIEYALDSKQTNGISDPKFLEQVYAFTEWYRQQPEVNHVYTYTDILLRLNKNLHGDDPEWYKLPESRELASQYLLLYEMSLPFGADLNNQINIDKSSLRITITLDNVKAKQILALEDRAQQWLKSHAPELQTPGAGPSVMFSHIGQKNIKSMISGTVIAIILISATLVFALGSWKLGLLSLIPNSFPAAITFGLWGIFIGEVNLGVAVVFSITLGIIVDDTVHFLSKFIRARKQHQASTEEAIHYAFTHVGAALLTTTILLATGFMTLAISDFSVNSNLGIMISMTIITAVVYDFLFLPPLLLIISKYLSSRKPALDTQKNT